ncbi:hypothetical protein NLG97_g8880 [Lecanicillium saksenae]|uniref:Uncharacterized protein n=1 Tax=Lecanicillium saksenae TaxID=468837 RepID=A0ACC1QJG0_9HYPO|nr:hypothetical protein NLG97_g8880 [Lecanicillium saksenae]
MAAVLEAVVALSQIFATLSGKIQTGAAGLLSDGKKAWVLLVCCMTGSVNAGTPACAPLDYATTALVQLLGVIKRSVSMEQALLGLSRPRTPMHGLILVCPPRRHCAAAVCVSAGMMTAVIEGVFIGVGCRAAVDTPDSLVLLGLLLSAEGVAEHVTVIAAHRAHQASPNSAFWSLWLPLRIFNRKMERCAVTLFGRNP